MWVVAQVLLGMAAANGVEWIVHKYVLHGLGRTKSSFWAFHWHEHHKECRQHDHVDPHYQRSLFGWHSQFKEVLALAGGGLVLSPIALFSPVIYATMLAWGVFYYAVHKRAHLDAEWARKWVPWHYDHHMALNQDANWGVTVPLWDYVLGTREVYFGTEKERTDRARRQARLAAKADQQADAAQGTVGELA